MMNEEEKKVSNEQFLSDLSFIESLPEGKVYNISYRKYDDLNSLIDSFYRWFSGETRQKALDFLEQFLQQFEEFFKSDKSLRQRAMKFRSAIQRYAAMYPDDESVQLRCSPMIEKITMFTIFCSQTK
jgi:hypothetical protein